MALSHDMALQFPLHHLAFFAIFTKVKKVLYTVYVHHLHLHSLSHENFLKVCLFEVL